MSLINREKKQIPYILAILPILFLIGILSFNVYIYGDDSLSGANQLALILSAGISTIIGYAYGIKWKDIINGISKSVKGVTPAIIILLLIGSLIGTWLISGIVPTMIYYGLQILNPKIFLFASCIICAIISVSTGSSWSTVGTIGIALLSIGQALEIPLGLIGGSIISGAYFGDKMSPLSDTTNLAAAVAGTDLFTHIRYMMYTTIPSFIITLLIFLIIGFNFNTSTSQDVNGLLEALDSSFNISIWLLIVPVLVIILIVNKVAAIPALLIGTLLGGLCATLFQEKIVSEIGNPDQNKITFVSSDTIESSKGYQVTQDSTPIQINYKDEELISVPYTSSMDPYATNPSPFSECLSSNNPPLIPPKENPTHKREDQQHYAITSYKAVVQAMSSDISIDSGDENISKLLSSSGMKGMLNTIWLVICAMIFGGSIEATGLLKRISSPIIKRISSTGELVTTTAGTCILFNITVSDQYLSVIIPGKMFADTYKERNLAPENLSRTLEDTGTVTSVLIPWNTCGAVQSGVLGIAVLTYLPYCFFNLISPLMTIAYAYLGIKIKKLSV